MPKCWQTPHSNCEKTSMKTAEIPAKKPITVKFQRTAIFGYVGLLILMPLWMFVFAREKATAMALFLPCTYCHYYFLLKA